MSLGSPSPAAEHLGIAIIGAGFGGIGMAISLADAGIHDFAVLERAATLGGTWRDNTYPGCACDVASSLYSFSFAPNPDWSRVYSKQPEILDYLHKVARARDVERHIRYGHELIEARWDEHRLLWVLNTSQGSLTASILVTAVGALGSPQTPNIPGLKNFAGRVFHTAAWDHDYDLAGKKVAVIGTGASAVQVVPAIQPKVASLAIFQRTPIWVLPRMDTATSAAWRWLRRRIPLVQRTARAGWYGFYESIVGLPQFVDQRFLGAFEAVGRYQLRRQVRDAGLRAKLTPKYRFACKRPAVSDDYYPAICGANVELVTSGIARITQSAVVTDDGVHHEVDALILATGFKVPHDISARIVGEGARTLSDFYGPHPNAYLGTTVTGYPNLFTLSGPFSGPGNQSFIYMLECQFKYVTSAVVTMRQRSIAALNTRADVQGVFHREMDQRSKGTSWVSGGCTGYYQNAEGGNAGLWPHWSFLYGRRTRRFDVRKYEIIRRNGVEAAS